MDHYGTCSKNIAETCQQYYATDGSVNSPSGLKKCRDQLREKGLWGYDRSPACKADPEKCNHTGCGYITETHGFKDYADLVRQQEPMMKKASDVYKDNVKAKMSEVQDKFKGFMGFFTKSPEKNAQAGGRRRRMQSKKIKKTKRKRETKKRKRRRVVKSISRKMRPTKRRRK